MSVSGGRGFNRFENQLYSDLKVFFELDQGIVVARCGRGSIYLGELGNVIDGILSVGFQLVGFHQTIPVEACPKSMAPLGHRLSALENRISIWRQQRPEAEIFTTEIFMSHCHESTQGLSLIHI